MGVSESIGSDVPNLMKDVPNLMKDVPNFVKDVPNFVKDVPRVSECVLRWGSTSNHFLMDSKLKLWTIHVPIGVPEAIGLNVPNFIKDVPTFVMDVPRVPKCIPMWGSTPNHFLMGSKIKS